MASISTLWKLNCLVKHQQRLHNKRVFPLYFFERKRWNWTGFNLRLVPWIKYLVSGVNVLESYTDNFKTSYTVDAIAKKTVQNSSTYQNSAYSLEGCKKPWNVRGLDTSPVIQDHLPTIKELNMKTYLILWNVWFQKCYSQTL